MITGGIRLRHIRGSNLEELQLLLEKLPYKVEIITINRMNVGEWFIHFTISDSTFEPMKSPEVQVSEETKVFKRSKK